MRTYKCADSADAFVDNRYNYSRIKIVLSFLRFRILKTTLDFFAKNVETLILKNKLTRTMKTQINLVRNRNRRNRKLEIGPGATRLEGFETLDIESSKEVDYVFDASKRLPFRDNTFELIYASHILEHIPWYQTSDVLMEWIRILSPGGRLEVWVPDGLKICRALVDAELLNNNDFHLDGWYKFNKERDPCIWAAGRLFTYGDGKGDPSHPNWHRALFTPRYLKQLFGDIGLKNVRLLDSREVRGHDHGWINLGVTGIKL